ncbi:MAG: alpha/beta fold hydrolase [Acidobacteria bacterium]|nr:MAG: alpha/beta fold hydrolase [Acidobacteriota bacterium]
MKVVRWVMLLAGIVAFAGAFYMFWQVRRHPLEIAERIGRDELERRGLVRRSLAGPRGEIVVWTRPGRGGPLVLVHGEDGSAAAWAAVVSRLPADRALVVPDLPGHGESAPRDGALRLDDLVDGLEVVLADASRDGPVTVVAHSLGAIVALRALGRVPGDAAEQLVIVAPWTLSPDDEAFAALFPASDEQALALLRRERKVKAPPIPDYLPPARVRRAAGGPLARLRADLAAGAGAFPPLPARVTVDLVLPEEDRIMPAERTGQLAARPGVRSVATLPACGHLPHEECPDELARVLTELLAAP